MEQYTEEDIYGRDGVEQLLDDDELSPEEEGFMVGYDTDLNE